MARQLSPQAFRLKCGSIRCISISILPFLLIAGAVQATPVTGYANIVGDLTVSGTSIYFAPTFASPTGARNTGDFTGLAGGTIMSLSGTPQTGSTQVSSFIVFTDGLLTPVYFDLTYISPGSGTQAACSSSTLGAVCTPAGSPFTLIQLPFDTVAVALQLTGNLYSGSATTGVSFGISLFSTQSTLSGTLPDVVAALSNGQGLDGVSYSASLVASSVAEPASMILAAVGMLSLAFLGRQRSRLS